MMMMMMMMISFIKYVIFVIPLFMSQLLLVISVSFRVVCLLV